MNTINPQAVEATLIDCLFTDEEAPDGKPPKDAVMAEGILRNFGLHPQRLESHREEVKGWLDLLSDDFRYGGGGGMSFLNACYDRNGEQWTGLHLRMEQLFVLGIGLGMARWTLPREMWDVLPGGMPYVTVGIGG